MVMYVNMMQVRNEGQESQDICILNLNKSLYYLLLWKDNMF